MEKSESISSLIQATIKVMAEVKGVEKNLTVGEGKSSYSGVADQDVKKVVGEAMERNGLTIFCTGIEEKTELSSWDEVDQWSKSTPKDTKRKQSIFTKVVTTYLLCHESGEYITLKGYGHGVDSQDKSAGKATTYALKYALLYTFLVPTGKIDDADNTHSEKIETPQKQTQTTPEKTQVKDKQPVKEKEVLTDEKFAAAVKYMKSGGTMSEIKKKYIIDQETEYNLDLAFNS